MPTLTAAVKPHLPGAPPPEPEHLPCPRCESTNTKFCYYNNYNFSQPRHFCKGCRRYWTHGGTLRDIPVGGGSRKNAKRSRLSNTSTYASNNTNVVSSSNLEFRHMAPPTTTLLAPFGGDHLRMCESFTSLLSGTTGGFFGFEEGFGRGVWPFHGVGIGGGEGGGYVVAGSGGGYGGGATWQVESGHEGGPNGGGGECFALPELAISTPGMM